MKRSATATINIANSPEITVENIAFFNKMPKKMSQGADLLPHLGCKDWCSRKAGKSPTHTVFVSSSHRNNISDFVLFHIFI